MCFPHFPGSPCPGRPLAGEPGEPADAPTGAKSGYRRAARTTPWWTGPLSRTRAFPRNRGNPGKERIRISWDTCSGSLGGAERGGRGQRRLPGALECFEFPMISLASFFPKKTARPQNPTASFLAGFLVLAHFYFAILRNRGHCEYPGAPNREPGL